MYLHRLNVLGAGTFGPLSGRKGHILTFIKLVVADALDAVRMKEEIFELPVLMNPKPLSVNFLIVPSAIPISPSDSSN